jgi:hypothetical protein
MPLVNSFVKDLTVMGGCHGNVEDAVHDEWKLA